MIRSTLGKYKMADNRHIELDCF